MYCQNCGKKMEENAKFCSCCGESAIAGRNNKKSSVPMDIFLKIDIRDKLHYASMICAAIIILLLLFSKWLGLGIWFVSGNVSVLEIFNIIGDLSGYEDTIIMLPISILLIILIIMVVALSLRYILKAFHAGSHSPNNEHIILGYSAMMTVAVICSSFVIITTIISLLSKDNAVNVSVNGTFYFIILLSCLNRFVLLPKYNEVIYKANKDWQDEQTYKDELWICESCNTVNEKQYISCKNCGEYK